MAEAKAEAAHLPSPEIPEGGEPWERRAVLLTQQRKGEMDGWGGGKGSEEYLLSVLFAVSERHFSQQGDNIAQQTPTAELGSLSQLCLRDHTSQKQ